MKILAEVTLLPLGVSPSISPYLHESQRIFRLNHSKIFEHSLGTNLEGDYNHIMKTIKHSLISIHSMGVTRIHTFLQIESRTDKVLSIDEKMSSLKKYEA